MMDSRARRQSVVRGADHLSRPISYPGQSMTLVRSNQRIVPISISEAVESVRNVIEEMIGKTRYMIDFYIGRRAVPPEIEAYERKLDFLRNRVTGLAELDMSNMKMLIDQAVPSVADKLYPIIDQLCTAIDSVQYFFINHYDRDLARKNPYGELYDILQYRGRQLEQPNLQQTSYDQFQPAESLVASPLGKSTPVFCRYAIAFINDRDQGRLSQVLPRDLTPEDRARLQESGGAFLSWDCPECAFNVRYHVVSSISSSIMSTDDVRTHASAPGVQYRPSWLVKCHLYQARPRDRRGSDENRPGISRRRMSLGDARRGNMTRRQSEIVGARNSGFNTGMFFFGTPRRSDTSIVVPTGKSAKYGCPFCFATGDEDRHMDYYNGRELAEHVASRHNVTQPPTGLLLEKFYVGINGSCADEEDRWDLNLRGQVSVSGFSR